jgi:hypothetical protein
VAQVQQGQGTQPEATERQVAYLEALLAERSHGYPDPAAVLAGARTSKAAASAMISTLVELPKVARVRVAPGNGIPGQDGTPPLDSSTVPAGHYAVDSATGNNDLDFYRVDCPEDGKWAGRVFVKRVIGGHPDTAVRGAEAKAALKRIFEAGWQEAARRYGQELGRCGVCNRTLTDETSRAYGIGPVCRDGW